MASVLRRQLGGNALDARRAELALTDLVDLPLVREAHRRPLAGCWELLHDLTICYAAYVALAEAFQGTVLTGDRHLARANGRRCPIDVFVGAAEEPPGASIATSRWP